MNTDKGAGIGVDSGPVAETSVASEPVAGTSVASVSVDEAVSGDECEELHSVEGIASRQGKPWANLYHTYAIANAYKCNSART